MVSAVADTVMGRWDMRLVVLVRKKTVDGQYRERKELEAIW